MKSAPGTAGGRHITLAMAAYALLVARRQRLLKKGLHRRRINLPLSPFPWLIGIARSASPPSRDICSADSEPSAGSAGVTAISGWPSTIIGGGDNLKRTALSPSHQ